jgi:hypothetical protein
MENSMRFVKNLEIELPYDPVILLLGIYPKECKTGYNRDTCTPSSLQQYSQKPSFGNKPGA